MGYIKEPEGVLLYVEHRQPTSEEDREVSEYIARSRAKRLAAQWKFLLSLTRRKCITN
jgi:hypothetical protein